MTVNTIETESLEAKLNDVEVPGFAAEFTPAEAELAGAFEESALTLDDAQASAVDVAGERLTSNAGEILSLPTTSANGARYGGR